VCECMGLGPIHSHTFALNLNESGPRRKRSNNVTRSTAYCFHSVTVYLGVKNTKETERKRKGISGERSYDRTDK
jgi:hypothetical protein